MILVALGANLASPAGPPEKTLICSIRALSERKTKIAAVSSFYRTPAWPDPDDPPFVNAIAAIETTEKPSDLMQILHDIEADFGRKRLRLNGPRTLDLDLIDYNGYVSAQCPALPHPRMAERAFVLIPLLEIAPDWRHPICGKTVSALVSALPAKDIAVIKKIGRPILS